jgi:hypothetical protein
MLQPFTRRSTSGSLPSQSFWGKFKPKNNKDIDRDAQMALSRQRLLTLVFGEMETIRMVRSHTLTSHSIADRVLSFRTTSL